MPGELVIGTPQDPLPLQGIVGLGQDILVNPNNFLWKRFSEFGAVSVRIPSLLQPRVPSDALLSVYDKTDAVRIPGYNGPLMKTNSDRYWSTQVSSIAIGNVAVTGGGNISVVFDTGSNYFGATSGIYDSLKNAACGTDIQINVDAFSRDDSIHLENPLNLLFPLKGTSSNGKCDTYIEKLDQSGFGEISNGHVIIVGTLGLRGKTVTIYPLRSSSPKRGEFYLSIRDN
jgi:hypothetical protein